MEKNPTPLFPFSPVSKRNTVNQQHPDPRPQSEPELAARLGSHGFETSKDFQPPLQCNPWTLLRQDNNLGAADPRLGIPLRLNSTRGASVARVRRAENTAAVCG